MRGGGGAAAVSRIFPRKEKGAKGRFPIQISRSGNFGKGRGSREEKETTKDEEGKATVFCFRRLSLKGKEEEIGGEAIVGLSPSLPFSTRVWSLWPPISTVEGGGDSLGRIRSLRRQHPFSLSLAASPLCWGLRNGGKKAFFFGQDQVTARVEPEPRRKDP